MFCMGCGAEVPPRAAVCSVCGRDTGRIGDARAARVSVETLDLAGVAGERGVPGERSASFAHSSLPAAAAKPSIGSGDLDQPGFPRDALGRSLIFTVLAMAADLLAPWVNLDGNRVAPSSLGLLSLLGVVWLALAVIPLLRPSLRATPIYAVAPLVVGATSLGMAAVVWMRVTLLGTQTVTESSGGFAFQPLGASSSADVGLYLFLAGAIVLIVAGYQVFLAAAHAQARAELRMETALVSPAQGASVNGGSTAPTPAREPTSASQSASAAEPDSTGTPAAPTSRPLPLPPPPAASQATPAGQHGVALPGSVAWSQTPNTPDFQRPSPSLGWRRRG